MQEDAIRALGVVCHDISVRGDRRFGNLGLAETLTFARSFFCGRPAKKKIFLREPGGGPPTTTAITINEYETRLRKDIANYFLNICPPDERSSTDSKYEIMGVRYVHNDRNLRPEGSEEAMRCQTNGWDITDPKILQQWFCRS